MSAIDPHVGTEIDCAEVQEQALTRFQFDRVKFAPVPDSAVEPSRMQSTGRSLRTEWYLDLMGPDDRWRVRPCGVLIEMQSPRFR